MNIKNIIRFIVVPFFLLLLWFFASIVTDPYSSLTTLEYPLSYKTLLHSPKERLFKNDRLEGSFIGKKNNLGIVSMRIKGGYSEIPGGEDTLNFKIKEEKSSSWYYENQYRVGAIREGDFLVFGFPKMPDSWSKKYIFEISSLKGTSENSLLVDKTYPTFYTKYIYNIKEVLKQKRIINLFLDKFFTMMIDSRSFFYSLLFLLPFIFYISLTVLKKILNSYIESIVILLILLDILQTRYEVYAFTICILGFWLMVIKRNKINYSYHVLLFFIFLLISIGFQLLGLAENATKSSMWAYYFFVIAGIQMVYEFNIKKMPISKK